MDSAKRSRDCQNAPNKGTLVRSKIGSIISEAHRNRATTYRVWHTGANRPVLATHDDLGPCTIKRPNPRVDRATELSLKLSRPWDQLRTVSRTTCWLQQQHRLIREHSALAALNAVEGVLIITVFRQWKRGVRSWVHLA